MVVVAEDPHPGAAIAALMKLSFDEEHRHAMCQLGALHAIANLIQVGLVFVALILELSITLSQVPYSFQ